MLLLENALGMDLGPGPVLALPFPKLCLFQMQIKWGVDFYVNTLQEQSSEQNRIGWVRPHMSALQYGAESRHRCS